MLYLTHLLTQAVDRGVLIFIPLLVWWSLGPRVAGGYVLVVVMTSWGLRFWQRPVIKQELVAWLGVAVLSTILVAVQISGVWSWIWVGIAAVIQGAIGAEVSGAPVRPQRSGMEPTTKRWGLLIFFVLGVLDFLFPVAGGIIATRVSFTALLLGGILLMLLKIVITATYSAHFTVQQPRLSRWTWLLLWVGYLGYVMDSVERVGMVIGSGAFVAVMIWFMAGPAASWLGKTKVYQPVWFLLIIALWVGRPVVNQLWLLVTIEAVWMWLELTESELEFRGTL